MQTISLANCFRSLRFSLSLLMLLALSASGSTSFAQAPGDLQIDVTNEGNSDFFLTPVWFGFHNGAFDMFNAGEAANLPLNSPAVEQLAEDGLTGEISQNFTDAPGIPGDIQGVVVGDGIAPPPVNPGETATAFVTPINTAAYPYFSFLSMVIPSNDSFIGNDNPLAYQVFDAAGDINDPSGVFTIQVFGNEIWDSGTEVNDEMGAAFSALGGVSSDENGVVALQGANELDDFLNTDTVAGTTIGDLIEPGELLATITISRVPEPSSVALGALGLLGFGWAAWRRR